MTLIPTVCATCKRLIFNRNLEVAKRYHCAAFPNGIPKEILFEGYDHRKYPYPGDNGIMYQKGEPTIIEVVDAR